jgi:hypothetical protein
MGKQRRKFDTWFKQQIVQEVESPSRRSTSLSPSDRWPRPAWPRACGQADRRGRLVEARAQHRTAAGAVVEARAQKQAATAALDQEGPDAGGRGRAVGGADRRGLPGGRHPGGHHPHRAHHGGHHHPSGPDPGPRPGARRSAGRGPRRRRSRAEPDRDNRQKRRGREAIASDMPAAGQALGGQEHEARQGQRGANSQRGLAEYKSLRQGRGQPDEPGRHQQERSRTPRPHETERQRSRDGQEQGRDEPPPCLPRDLHEGGRPFRQRISGRAADRWRAPRRRRCPAKRRRALRSGARAAPSYARQAI